MVPHWPRLRFSIRTILICVALAGIGSAILAVSRREYRKRIQAAAELRAMGASAAGFDEHGNPDYVSVSPRKALQISPDIARFKRFRHLDLSHAIVTDESIRNISGLAEVEVLHLTHSDITDAQVELLARIGSLKILRLNATGVTDDAIPAIASINGLTSVDLSETRVSNAGAEELRRRCPSIVVRHESE